MTSTNEFIKEYTRAISEGYAAVFAGAGLSRGSGYINWKELIRPLAKEIGLDVDKEHDLVSVAQYYRNEKSSRAAINQKIINEFTREASSNENTEILTRLQINTYWTTNYDETLEDSLKSNNRKADVKTTQASLANNIYDRDAVVYKMHGDVRCPDQAVLTKDDFEVYGNKNALFRTALQGDLISKTFLFIGFSFEDPNLDYILSQIRILLGESSREHYCFFQKIKKNDTDTDEDYLYNVVRQDLKIKDLCRYGIQAILLDSYDEITSILSKIEHNVLLKNIFISGSIADYQLPWNLIKVSEFTYGLAKKLVSKDYKIISGFGMGVGSNIINGALEEIMKSKYKHIEEHLCLLPFPQISSDSLELEKLWQVYREDIIAQAGIVIFIFGNKKEGEQTIIADGMIKEFEIAKSLGKIIIPVASTGWASLSIYKSICENLQDYSYLQESLDQLENIVDTNEIIELVYKIVNSQQIL